MTKSTYNQLVDYCFNELSADQRSQVEIDLIKSEATISAINGINALKRKLGNRKAVEKFMDQKLSESRKKLFLL